MGESTRDVIDINESNFKLETQNQKFGKVTRERRCNAWGKYQKGTGTVSLLMAISSDERVGEAFSFHGGLTCGIFTITCWSCATGLQPTDLDGIFFLQWIT
jgi:hypothetical protein